MLISRMTSAAHYSTAALCVSSRLGVAEGKGGVMRYWGCVGREAITSVQGKVFADGECGWQRGSGEYLKPFTLLHACLLSLYILHLPNSQAASSIA